MARCGDDSGRDFSNLESSIVGDFLGLELGDFSFRVGPHDNRNIKLRMPSNKVSMIMCEHNIFQVGSPLADKLPIDKIVIGGVDDIGLTIGLNIVSEDSKHAGLELGDVDAGFLVFGDDFNFGSHVNSISGKYNEN